MRDFEMQNKWRHNRNRRLWMLKQTLFYIGIAAVCIAVCGICAITATGAPTTPATIPVQETTVVATTNPPEAKTFVTEPQDAPQPTTTPAPIVEVVEVEETPEPTPTAPPVIEWTLPLTESEFVTACRIVMGESGAEPYEGKVAVAQCILAACMRDGIVPSEVRTEYRYAGWKEEYTAAVERAVLAVFRDGERVCEEEIIFFYAPKLCTSKWHETQDYVLTIGGHKFFAEKGA